MLLHIKKRQNISYHLFLITLAKTQGFGAIGKRCRRPATSIIDYDGSFLKPVKITSTLRSTLLRESQIFS